MELTPEIRAKRVAIAEDARAQVVADKFRVRPGVYLNVIDPEPESSNLVAVRSVRRRIAQLIGEAGGDLQACIDEVAPYCEGCFRGGLLLSKIRKYDEVPASMIFDADGQCRVHSGTTTAGLAGIYDEVTLARCEIAFERTSGAASYLEIDDRACCKHLYGEIDDPTRRMLAILANLIDNNGEFVVPAPAATS